jgi:tRNA(Ile2) C34 agmatinyltransferase TiaS
MGTASVEQFVCMLPLGDLVELLRKADYDKIQGDIDWEDALTRCNQCGDWMIKNWKCKTCGKEETDNANV